MSTPAQRHSTQTTTEAAQRVVLPREQAGHPAVSATRTAASLCLVNSVAAMWAGAAVHAEA